TSRRSQTWPAKRSRWCSLRGHDSPVAPIRPVSWPWAVGIGRWRGERATMKAAREGVGARGTGRRSTMLRNLMGLMPYVIMLFAIGTVVSLVAIVILIARAIP